MITVLIVATTVIILLLSIFAITSLLFYAKKRNSYAKKLHDIKLDFDKLLLKTQIEIQEQTFQNLSREIHDNIGLSLTLAKLNLNTLDIENSQQAKKKVSESILLITTSIQDLSSISHSLNSETIKKNGLIRALEEEIERIIRISLIRIDLIIEGSSVFLDHQKELVIFRIIQEALNNIIKHAEAQKASIKLYYHNKLLELEIADDGKGFDPDLTRSKNSSGLINMTSRAKMIDGSLSIKTGSSGTMIKVIIPYKSEI